MREPWAVQAFPFQVTHVLTDGGSCFTAAGFEAACRTLGVEHRKTRPYTPKTNGMVERFNGRIQSEGLGITVASHGDLETLLEGFNQAYNARRQRVLKGRSPAMVVHERLSAAPELVNPRSKPPNDPSVLPKALKVVARAKDVSHPDTQEAEEWSSGSVGRDPQRRRRKGGALRDPIRAAVRRNWRADPTRQERRRD